MTRGDLVTIALPGDFGKPRPALVIQSDMFADTGTVTVLLVSGTLVDAPLIRATIEPNPANGLRTASQVMVDKAMTVRRDKVGPVIGRLDAEAMLSVTRALAVFLRLLDCGRLDLGVSFIKPVFESGRHAIGSCADLVIYLTSTAGCGLVRRVKSAAGAPQGLT